MTTELLVREDAAGLNLYFAAQNAAGQWLDYSDWTFKALGSVTTVGLAATPQDLASGRKRYVASLDLEELAPGLPAVECTLGCFIRAGATPAPLTDTLAGQLLPFVAQLGAKGHRAFQTQVKLGATTTEGTLLELMAWLEADGRKVPLHTLDDDATCQVVCLRRGNFPQFTIDTTGMGPVNANHCFEPTYNNPNFTADRIYRAEAIITASGLTFSGNLKAFSVVP